MSLQFPARLNSVWLQRGHRSIGTGTLTLPDAALVADRGVRQDIGQLAEGLRRQAQNRAGAVGATAIGANIEVRAATG